MFEQVEEQVQSAAEWFRRQEEPPERHCHCSQCRRHTGGLARYFAAPEGKSFTPI